MIRRTAASCLKNHPTYPAQELLVEIGDLKLSIITDYFPQHDGTDNFVWETTKYDFPGILNMFEILLDFIKSEVSQPT